MQESSEQTAPGEIRGHVDEKLPHFHNITLALQHVLVMYSGAVTESGGACDPPGKPVQLLSLRYLCPEPGPRIDDRSAKPLRGGHRGSHSHHPWPLAEAQRFRRLHPP